MSDRDPNEGYVSSDQAGWVPLPEGTKRVAITLNVPEETDIFDLATEVSATFSDSDPTVWESAQAFVRDWSDGAA